MTPGAKQRWLPYLSSILLHSVFVLLVVGGWFKSKIDTPALETLAIHAVVVDPRRLVAPSPSEIKSEPVSAPVVVSKPALNKLRTPSVSKKISTTNLAPIKKTPLQKSATEKDATQKLPFEKMLALKPDAQQLAELRQQMDVEVHDLAVRQSGLVLQWAAAIQARVTSKWIRPMSARAGLECRVAVTQVQGGAVVAVKVLDCNADETVRQSIEAAVYRASPLPPPPDPSLFERNLELRFKPND